MSAASARKSPIQAIDRASAMLDAVAAAGPAGVGLAEIAEGTGLAPSTARTLLSSLVIHGLLAQDARRRYLLGPRLVELTRLYGVKVDLASAASPFLRRLWDGTPETVHLAVFQGGRRVDLAVLVSPQLLNVNPTVAPQAEPGSGAARSLFTTAAGKVLLAWADASTVADAVQAAAGEPRRGVELTPSRAERMLARVREDGYATNVEDEEPGVCGIAVPVFDATGSVVAALCVGYPAVRRSSTGDAGLLDAVRAAATDISGALGAPVDGKRVPGA